MTWEWLALERFAGGNWSGLWPGLATLAVLTTIDLLLRADAIPTAFAVAPFIAALAGGRWAAIVVGSAAVALTVLSGVWNENVGEDGYFVRIAVVAIAAVAAALAARAAAETRRTVQRFGMLNDVASAADGTTPLPVTMQLIGDLIVPDLADYCMIDTVAEGRVDRAAVRASGPDRERIESVLRGQDPSLPDQIVEAEHAVIEPRFWERVTEAHLKSIARDEQDLEFLRGLRVSSVITVALVSRGRRIGALTLVSTGSGRRYTRDDVRFANMLGDRVALALDNAGLFSDLESVGQRMDGVMDVLDESVLIFDRSRAVVFANDAAARMLGFAAAEELVGATEQTLRGRFDLYDEAGAPLDIEEFSPMKALGGGEAPHQIVRAISRRDARELWLRAKSRAVEGADGEPLYAVTALDDVTEIKEAEFEQTLLAGLGELFGAALDYERMAQRLAELLIPQLADSCGIYAKRADGALKMIAGATPDRDGADADPVALPQIGTAAFRQALHGKAPGPFDAGEGFGLVLPLRIGASEVGVLALLNHADRRPFEERDRALAEKIAERAAVALEIARLGTERTEIARTLQQGLLPAPLPHIPGWSLAAFYSPAGAENEVGGDFYDAFAYRGGWMLVVGDVTGRGPRAASITALARYTLRTASALSGDPLVALDALNRALLAQEDPTLCTVAAIAINEGGGEARIAVAGHPPPLLVDRAGVREVTASGPVLGAFADAEWDLKQLRLEPGRQLVIYTDGVTEAPGPEGRFGEERLRSRLRGAATPVASIDRVEQALSAFCAGERPDDAAVLALGVADAAAADPELEQLIDGRERAAG